MAYTEKDKEVAEYLKFHYMTLIEHWILVS